MVTRRGRARRRLAIRGGVLIGWLLAAGVSAGCKQQTPTLTAAFPVSQVASPWILVGEVWEGPLDAARESLGDDAETWARHAPQRVRLAVYQHEGQPANRIIARAFEFADPTAAQAVRDTFRPSGAAEFAAGDGGFWTDLGVLYSLGPHVIEVFGNEPEWKTQISASYVGGLIARRAVGK